MPALFAVSLERRLSRLVTVRGVWRIIAIALGVYLGLLLLN